MAEGPGPWIGKRGDAKAIMVKGAAVVIGTLVAVDQGLGVTSERGLCTGRERDPIPASMPPGEWAAFFIKSWPLKAAGAGIPTLGLTIERGPGRSD